MTDATGESGHECSLTVADNRDPATDRSVHLMPHLRFNSPLLFGALSRISATRIRDKLNSLTIDKFSCSLHINFRQYLVVARHLLRHHTLVRICCPDSLIRGFAESAR